MSRGASIVAAWLDGFPRVSGDEPALRARMLPFPSFSPRERG